MSWRVVVINTRSKLDCEFGYLVIRNTETVKIHLNEISVLMIETPAAAITTNLMIELMNHKIKVIFCDDKRNPCCELISYYGSHDSSNKIKFQLEWSRKTKELLWTIIVREKIKNQYLFLSQLNKYQEALLIKSYLNNLKLYDATNREGHAAKVYFNALFGSDFRRSDSNFINAALNYGYSILLSVFNREIVSNGYLTQLGIFHDNMFNYFNLTSDLMEPFRVLIDREVWNMKLMKFDSEEKHLLINVLNKEVIVDNKKQYVLNAIKIYCHSVFDCLNNNDVSDIKFYEL